MVSNALKIPEEEILEALARARREQSDTPEYQQLRKELPREWPL
jgi:hypothetical protein